MGQGTSQILFLVVFIAIMYLLLIRPQRKKEKAINLMRNNLRAGDEIVTIGGICGKIVKIRDETLTIQVGADKIKFEVMRWAISRVVESSELSSGSRRRAAAEDDEPGDRKKAMPKKMKRASAKEEAAEGDAADDAADDADDRK